MTSDQDEAAESAADLTGLLTSRGYHSLLLASAAVGFPIAAIAFGFLAAVTSMEKWVWHTVPTHFGWGQPKAWYAVLVLTFAGLLVGLVVARLPGRGGHLSAKGLGGGLTQPIDLTGVVLAAALSLVLGTVLGPEAPLIALGGGLAILAAKRTRLRDSQQGVTLIAVAGSAAAIATVFGNPLVAAVLMLEVVGFAGSQVVLVLLPCLVSSGIGALICRRLGLRAAEATAAHTLAATTAAGVIVGLLAAAYTLITGRSVLDVLESGQAALPALVGSPHSWSVVTLILLLLFKGAAYGISLGSFRGGPTFPAVYLGAALGVLVGALPGVGTTAGIAMAMTAATTAVLRLPVTSIVLVVLLLGPEGTSQLPIILLAAAVAMVSAVALDGHSPHPGPDAEPDPGRNPARP